MGGGWRGDVMRPLLTGAVGVGEEGREVDERRKKDALGGSRAALLHDVSRHICLQLKVIPFS